MIRSRTVAQVVKCSPIYYEGKITAIKAEKSDNTLSR